MIKDFVIQLIDTFQYFQLKDLRFISNQLGSIMKIQNMTHFIIFYI